MKYTEFGEYFRILRLKHREVLASAAVLLGVTSSFISAVECGKKQIPEDWETKIINHYNLNKKEQDELKKAIERSKSSIKIDLVDASIIQKDIALQFQRSFKDLDDDTISKIQLLLKGGK